MFMFGCQMVFFYKMAVLISLTISLSLLFALGYFMALCAVAGPSGDFASVHKLAERCGLCAPRDRGAAAPTIDNGAANGDSAGDGGVGGGAKGSAGAPTKVVVDEHGVRRLVPANGEEAKENGGVELVPV